jgi:hypothetical protein
MSIYRDLLWKILKESQTSSRSVSWNRSKSKAYGFPIDLI